MGIWATQILLITLISVVASQDEYVTEDPPLSFVPDEEVPIIIEEKPMVDPVHMPTAAQIIVETSEDLSDLNYTGINWTAFYGDFQPLEANLTA